jgi:periplasmic divalent cation tolerance protein
MYQAVEKAIRELHSYELPAIYAVPLTKVFEPYGDWIKTNSQGSNQGEA